MTEKKTDLLLQALQVIARDHRSCGNIAKKAIAQYELQSIPWKVGDTSGPNESGYYSAGIDIVVRENPGPGDDGWHHSAMEFHSKDKAQAEGWRDIVFSTISLTAAPELRPWSEELQDAREHLAACIQQSLPDRDDQIIMDHVRAANEILKVIVRKTRKS
jgi:hypothetical protein